MADETVPGAPQANEREGEGGAAPQHSADWQRRVDAMTDEEVKAWHRERSVESIRDHVKDHDDRDERRKKTLPRKASVALPVLWFEISERCQVTPSQAADFIEMQPDGLPQIYAPNWAGLFAPLLDPNCAMQVVVDAYNAASNARWDRGWCTKNLGFLVLSAEVAQRLLNDAIEAYCDEPPPLSVEGTATPAYLDPGHPRYAPKLAAAVRAWLAADNSAGKTPKQVLTLWLRENAAVFGLASEGGKPNEQGIEECAKVANWRMDGGAPKTPGA